MTVEWAGGGDGDDDETVYALHSLYYRHALDADSRVAIAIAVVAADLSRKKRAKLDLTNEIIR